MPRTDEPHIDTVLSDAEILVHDYDGYDTDAALRRVTELATGPGVPVTRPRPPLSRRLTAAEQAAHDLNLAVSLIVDAPQAATSLQCLLDRDRTEPAGALVFAALLHLAGHREASRFWWQFAAGGGDSTAAFCLYLLHQERAEFRDAAYWRAQSRQLSRPGATRPHGVRPPLLAESVRRELISLCRRGHRPTLPPRLEALIHGLPTDATDLDFGDIPRPDHDLTRTLPQEAPYPA
ncbi:glycoprotein [Streptomyces sp. NPDC004726]